MLYFFARENTDAWRYCVTKEKDFVTKPEGGCRYTEWRTNDGEGGVAGIDGSVGK
jgi:hypothetical protein